MNVNNLNLFGSPDLLRSIHPGLLLEWLAPVRTYLVRRGFPWPADAAAPIEYPSLSRILLEPTSDLPTILIESLYLVQDMACTAGMESILEHAEETGRPLDLGPDPTPADAAVWLWLHDPALLEQLHNRREMLRPRAFRYFTTDADPLPAFAGPQEAQLHNLQARLNEFYVAWRRGPGARVFCYPRDHEFWFLVRHGALCRREAALEGGEPKTLFYRPQGHAVLVYDPGRGEMGVNCSGPRERQVLLRHFGRELFGRADFFPGHAKYTLEPLIHRGRASLACGDVPALAQVRLTGVQFYDREAPWQRVTREAEDIFELIEHRKLKWPKRAEEITRATFQVCFRRRQRPLTLTIVPCNQAVCSQEADRHVLETWLQRREFCTSRRKGKPSEN